MRIPKSVFESAPAPAPTQNVAGSSSKVTSTQVKRLDGSVEEVVTGLPPQNPNFVPRTCWPGGKIVTNDKLEVLLRFHERKGIALTPELQAKKAELEAAPKVAPEASKGVKERMGGKKKGNKGKGGKLVTLGGAEGGLSSSKAAAAEPVVAPKAAPEVSAWYKNRPKGGVKVLGGAEGALTGGKRAADEAGIEGQPPAKQPA